MQHHGTHLDDVLSCRAIELRDDVWLLRTLPAKKPLKQRTMTLSLKRVAIIYASLLLWLIYQSGADPRRQRIYDDTHNLLVKYR
jgi:hypothetical protein